jgi:hypothetical protein
MDDLSIVCYTETHSLYQVLGAVGVLLYALGIPLAFLGEAPSQLQVEALEGGRGSPPISVHQKLDAGASHRATISLGWPACTASVPLAQGAQLISGDRCTGGR